MAGPQGNEGVPEAALAAFDAGMREYVAENNEAALAHLTEAITVQNDFADALYVLGLVQLRLGAADAAAASLQKAADSSPNTILRDYALAKLASIQRAPAPTGEG
jgi:tetratricopeptide (TPR) repeat protein